MKHALIAAAFLILVGSDQSFAYYCKDGQQPVPPEVAAQMALPLCGFAATKRWGPNGCQLCDSSNMHPNPFAADGAYVARRSHHARKYKY
jgi:hypothetical protein